MVTTSGGGAAHGGQRRFCGLGLGQHAHRLDAAGPLASRPVADRGCGWHLGRWAAPRGGWKRRRGGGRVGLAALGRTAGVVGVPLVSRLAGRIWPTKVACAESAAPSCCASRRRHAWNEGDGPAGADLRDLGGWEVDQGARTPPGLALGSLPRSRPATQIGTKRLELGKVPGAQLLRAPVQLGVDEAVAFRNVAVPQEGDPLSPKPIRLICLCPCLYYFRHIEHLAAGSLAESSVHEGHERLDICRLLQLPRKDHVGQASPICNRGGNQGGR